MATFNVKGRKKGAVTTTTVDALNRDEAISKVVKSAAEGEEFDVMQVEEVPADVVAPQRSEKK